MQISVASSALVSIPIIEAILESSHELVSIITNPDKASGRGQKVLPNELAEWAQGKDLPISKPADNSELNRHLLAAQPQLIITVAYGKIVPVELLHGPRFGWINVHFSLLPKYRGAAPVQWALLNGETTTGFSIFKLDKGMDTGPLYLSREIDIQPDDTTSTLLNKLSLLAAPEVLEVIATIGKTKAVAQPTAGVTYAPKISKEEGRIAWSDSTENILRKSRALSANPGIWSTYKGEKIGIVGLQESIIANSLKNIGEIELLENELVVRTSDSVLQISEVIPFGKKRMLASDFARGARLEAGSKFE